MSTVSSSPQSVAATGVEAAPVSGDLDKSLRRGVAWTAGVKWLSQILTWPATAVAARILTPADYGLIAMSAVFLGLIQMVSELGLGTAIVRHRDLTRVQIQQIDGLCVLFGFIACAVTIAAAYPMAIIYHTPALVGVVMAISVNFVIGSLATVPESILRRDLHFRFLAVNEAIGALIQSALVVLFAWIGFRYWSLVLSASIASTITTTLVRIKRPNRIAWPKRRDIGEAVTFGNHIVGSRIGWYIYSNADFFIVGRRLGQAALGAYSFGWEFATLPVEKVTALIGRVGPPIFSAVQNDHHALRRYLARLTSGIALLTFPAGLGLSLVAHDAVLLVLGEKWRAATVPLQLLAVYATVRSIIPIVGQVGTMVGLSRFIMRNSVAAAIIMPASFLIGAHWGTTGVATAWILAYPLVAIPQCVVVFRRIGMKYREFGRAVWPAASSALLMIPVVLLAQHAISANSSLLLRVIVQVLSGAATYVACMLVLHRDEIAKVLELVRGAQPAS